MTSPLPPEVHEFLKPPVVPGEPGQHVATARAAIDRYSPTWGAVAAYLRAEIEELRTALEVPGLPPTDTEHLRGQIVAHRATLSIADLDQSRQIDRQNLRAGY